MILRTNVYKRTWQKTVFRVKYAYDKWVCVVYVTNLDDLSTNLQTYVGSFITMFFKLNFFHALIHKSQSNGFNLWETYQTIL